MKMRIVKCMKKIIITLSVIIATVLLVPFVTFVILHYFILTPEMLTRQVVNEVNKRTNLNFSCGKIELAYLESWPSISINIENGKIRVPLPEKSDSVSDILNVTFKEAYGTIELMTLLQSRILCIEDIFIEQPDLYMVLGQKFPPLLKKKSEKDKKNKIKFKVNQINVSDAKVRFRHLKKNIGAEADHVSLLVKGNLASSAPTITVDASCASVSGIGDADLFGQKVSLSVSGHCDVKNKFNELYLKDTRLTLDLFPFEIRGSLQNLHKGGTPYVDLQLGLQASSLKELLGFIPEKYLPGKNAYSIVGNASLKGRIKGKLKGGFPDWRLKGLISQGSIHKKGVSQGIDTISLDLEAGYRQDIPDSCFVRLYNVNIKGLSSFIQMDSHIANLLEEPFITADLKGDIDFDRLGNEFISKKQAILKGKMKTDLSVAFKLKDLKEKRLNRIWAEGLMKTDYMEIRSPHYNLNTYISGLEMRVGYKKNKSDFITNAEVLSGTAYIDSLKMVYGKSVYVDLSDLHLRSNTVWSQDDNSVTPVTVHLNCSKVQTKTSQNSWVLAEQLELHAGTKPSGADPKRNEAALVLDAGILKYLDTYNQNAVILRQSKFVSEARPHKKKKPFSSEWDIKGMLDFDHSQVYSVYFPLMVTLKHTRIGFENNQFILNRMQIQAGKSDCMLSGMLGFDSIPNGKSRKLEGNLHLLSRNIDYDELKQAFLYGEAQRRTFSKSNTANITFDNMEQKFKPNTSVAVKEHPFYIPDNIKLDIQMDIDHMGYREVDLQQVSGNIFIQNQQACSNLSTRTNLGKIDLLLLYDSRKKEQVRACFDLNLQDMLIGQIHRVFPSIVTLMPFTRSMDGLVDCRLTADGILDDQMLPVLGKTKAACTLDGQKLTLLDNKTFNEIARKLRFKSKKRNIIDKLSTNLILKNNQIEVIPSLVEWDRYQAVIGGTHSTGLTFNYHVTVLKSPVPLDFGIDLTGRFDEFHYKIGKCKFKNLYKDGGIAHQKQTDMRMLEFREGIIEKIKLH